MRMREVSAPTRQPITCQPRSISARVELSRRVTPLRACKPTPFPRPACPLSLVTSPAPLFLPPFLSAYSLPRRSDFFTLLLVNTEGLFFLCACWCFLLSLPSSTTTHSRHFYSSAAARRHLCRKNISRKKVRALILSTDLFLPSLQRQSPPLPRSPVCRVWQTTVTDNIYMAGSWKQTTPFGGRGRARIRLGCVLRPSQHAGVQTYN